MDVPATGLEVIGLSNTGLRAEDANATDVDAKTWRLVTIHAEQTWADGTLDSWEVQTLQSPNG